MLGETEADILNIMMTRYTTAAGVVILVYDCLLTIGDEVGDRYTRLRWLLTLFIVLQIRLIWPGPLTVAKFLYYFNRYVSIAGIIALNFRMYVHKFVIRF
jgi:hypothetical protein